MTAEVSGADAMSLPQSTWRVAFAWFQSAAMFVLRIALAVPFVRSGLVKWDGFLSLAPSTLYLFESEFKLHILGGEYPFPFPALMATLSATGEIVLPVLLVLGLATRFAALGVLGMAAIIQLTYPSHWLNEGLPWAAMSLTIMAFGPGRIAIDAWVARLMRR